MFNRLLWLATCAFNCRLWCTERVFFHYKRDLAIISSAIWKFWLVKFKRSWLKYKSENVACLSANVINLRAKNMLSEIKFLKSSIQLEIFSSETKSLSNAVCTVLRCLKLSSSLFSCVYSRVNDISVFLQWIVRDVIPIPFFCALFTG